MHCILEEGGCLCLFCIVNLLEENHHQVMASLPKGRTLPLCNLLWQVDAVLIPVLRNILCLVPTNWPLMESVFVWPDSCQEHLQSCFNSDGVLMAQKPAWSPVVGSQISFAWILAMCKNMTFFVVQLKMTKWLQDIEWECQLQQTKGCCRESSVLFLPPHSCLLGKTKAETRKDLAALCTQLFSTLRSSLTLLLCCASI